MPEPIRIPLSVHQQARFRAFDVEEQAICSRRNEAVTSIIAGSYDPAPLQGWDIRAVGPEIVCTPPAEIPAPLEHG